MNAPRTIQIPQGELTRTTNHEMDDSWPAMIEIVAYWGEGRKGKSRRIEIPADQFFGRGHYGAPLSGDQLVRMVDNLRKSPR